MTGYSLRLKVKMRCCDIKFLSFPTMLDAPVHRGKNATHKTLQNPSRPCVMRVCGPNKAGRTVQNGPTFLRFASAITEQRKCWELVGQKFDRFQTLRNNSQQHATNCSRMYKRTQHVIYKNVGSCWPKIIIRSFARQLRV